jgi:hypothetical protein
MQPVASHEGSSMLGFAGWWLAQSTHLRLQARMPRACFDAGTIGRLDLQHRGGEEQLQLDLMGEQCFDARQLCSYCAF